MYLELVFVTTPATNQILASYLPLPFCLFVAPFPRPTSINLSELEKYVPTPTSPHNSLPFPEDPSLYYPHIYVLVSTMVLFPSGFPTKTFCTPLPSSIRATCPAHLVLLDFINRKILGEEYRSLSSSLCNFLHSPVTPSLLGPNILLNTLTASNSFRSLHNNILSIK